MQVSDKISDIEPLANVFLFMVRYLTTNGESAAYNPTPPFVLRYRRARGGLQEAHMESLQNSPLSTPRSRRNPVPGKKSLFVLGVLCG